MRLVLAMLKHETNTFSPVVTDVVRFAQWGLQFGEDVIAAYENTSRPLAAYMKLARARGAEIVTPVAAEAMPGGPVTRGLVENRASWVASSTTMTPPGPMARA
jgi:microcystin degradation protein MlrC